MESLKSKCRRILSKEFRCKKIAWWWLIVTVAFGFLLGYCSGAFPVIRTMEETLKGFGW